MRTVCNSVANMTYNLFGYVPAPYIYGFMYDHFGGNKSHAGFYTIEVFGFLSFFFSAVFFARKKLAWRKHQRERQLSEEGGVTPDGKAESDSRQAAESDEEQKSPADAEDGQLRQGGHKESDAEGLASLSE